MDKQICRKIIKSQKESMSPTQKLSFYSENGKLQILAILSGLSQDKEEKMHISYDFTDEEASDLHDFLTCVLNDKEECRPQKGLGSY